MDGGYINRSFRNIICDSGTNMAANVCDLGRIIIMAYSHVVAKKRNILYSSGPSTADKINLIHPSGPISWHHFQNG